MNLLDARKKLLSTFSVECSSLNIIEDKICGIFSLRVRNNWTSASSGSNIQVNTADVKQFFPFLENSGFFPHTRLSITTISTTSSVARAIAQAGESIKEVKGDINIRRKIQNNSPYLQISFGGELLQLKRSLTKGDELIFVQASINKALVYYVFLCKSEVYGDKFVILSDSFTQLKPIVQLSNITENTQLKDCVKLPKPFLLLAGISGTGKTRFVREQAKNSGSLTETYNLVSVRPDWHEPSDLLGYVSRLSGKAEYIVTDVLKFLVQAWKEISKADITLNEKIATGDFTAQQEVRPFWLCLDEMNLAPVEQYFADYLSILETREWHWNVGQFTYRCDAILKPHIFQGVDQKQLRESLGLIEEEFNDLWQHFVSNGISLPFNLIVAGTVNMDETTHGFSRKVIDRALTFDFGEFFPNKFNEFFESNKKPKVLSYPVWSDGRNKTELASTFDSDSSLSIALLESINAVLNNTPFKLAYRALNELLLSVMTNKPATEIELQAVWDDFLMCKVLPRIEGDIDKLTKAGKDKNIIEQLEELLSKQLNTIWDGETRPDLYRKSLENEMAIVIECRSKAKLKWMNDQLANGFTSFWP